MTDLEWQKLEETLAHMTPNEKRRLMGLLRSSLSTEETSTTDPLLGLLADEPELVDQIVESAYAAREQHPLRGSDNG